MCNKKCKKKGEAMQTQTSIADFTICTVGRTGETGKGDSGGPLVVKGRDGKYHLVGILSGIIDYTNINYFTSVTEFKNCIENKRSI